MAGCHPIRTAQRVAPGSFALRRRWAAARCRSSSSKARSARSIRATLARTSSRAGCEVRIRRSSAALATVGCCSTRERSPTTRRTSPRARSSTRLTDAPLTLGTAGHIDHGKTALVRALTGKDTDRLPEEHKRGISIELGYARLELPSGRTLSVVDVPGHERFVRTMVAGATGIDLFLMCIASDDGVMPQTREHMAVLRQLGVERGVVAITKSDVADPDVAADEAAELAPGAEIVPVSALRREGLDELLRALERVAGETASRAVDGDAAARLHVDRSFSL